MRVGVEIRNIHFGASGGIAPLIRGVLGTAMHTHPEAQFAIFATLFNSDFFGPLPANATLNVLPLHSYWQDLAASARLGDLDVIFRGYPGPDIVGYPSRRQIVLIPDLQHEVHPEFFSASDRATRRRLFGAALKGAGAIATISAFARQTILHDPANRCPDVFLMPPASQLDATIEPDEASPEFAQQVRGLAPYFYFPANLWPHKNHARLLDAFQRVRGQTDVPLSLVLTGHPEGWEALRADRDHRGVHHLGFVAPTELRYLYRHALALVFPSLYEGFGMPLLEAFDNSCPVTCSDTTSLPEVAAGAALTFDPASVDSIAAAMERIVNEPALRESLISLGHARRGAYSWEASAAAFMAACDRVGTSTPAADAEALPRVSIVTPSYNQGRFLRRTIDSVLSQDYPDIELIVMDGGSTDDSVEILRSYGDRITWVSEKDRGQTHAINKGLAQAQGDIHAYLNSDDTLEPGAVRRIVQYFAENPTCDMLYGDANYIDVDDAVTGRYNTAPYSFERLMFDCCVCQPATFWRASIARKVGAFDEALDFVMDYDYWLRIDRAGGEIRFLPEVLANSRLYPETKTMSRRGDIYREIFEVCRRHGGYVDRNYYLGYWNHRVTESPRILGRFIGLAPGGAVLAAKAHFAWDSKPSTGWHFITRELPSMVRRALRLASAAAPALAGRIAPPRVEGFFLDGWLGPTLAVRKARRADGVPLYVTGRPSVPCTLDVLADGKKVHQQSLTPDAITRIEFRAEVRHTLSLQFSASALDAAERPLAFQVFATNLFAEADLAA